MVSSRWYLEFNVATRGKQSPKDIGAVLRNNNKGKVLNTFSKALGVVDSRLQRGRDVGYF